jgi:hypothetical protein
VFDELTKLKNPSGVRFKSLNKIIDHIKIRWGLTGSFTSNGLEDVFGQCKIIDQQLLGRSKGAFMQKYFVLLNKDFGEWVFAHHIKNLSVIFLRYPFPDMPTMADRVCVFLTDNALQHPVFVTLTPKKIRIRQL